jgi:hypothetical protein
MELLRRPFMPRLVPRLPTVQPLLVPLTALFGSLVAIWRWIRG